MADRGTVTSITDTNEQQINPATRERQDQIIAKQDIFADYHTQVIDEATTASTTYIGKSKSDGTWLFQRIDETGSTSVIEFANVSNNPLITTYAAALAAVDALSYEYIEELTF